MKRFNFKQTWHFVLYLCLFILLSLTFSSCTSKSKKSQTSTSHKQKSHKHIRKKIKDFKNKRSFIADSIFLRQKNKISIKNEKPQTIRTYDRKSKLKTVDSDKEPGLLHESSNEDSKAYEVSDSTLLAKRNQYIRFPIGEKLTLSLSYFGVEAGKVEIGVDSEMLFNGEDVFYFYAKGDTSRVFSLVYKVRDKIDSLWSLKNKRPYSLAFKVDQSKQKYESRTYYDWKNSKADYFEEGWYKKKGNYRRKRAWKLPTTAQDLVSAIFYVRTLDLKVGDVFEFNMMDNKRVIKTKTKVLKNEIIKTKIGKLDALVLKPSFKTKGKFKKVGDITIWLSNDKYKRILRIDSKIKIGKVSAKIHSLETP